MTISYIIVTCTTALALGYAGYMNFVRDATVLEAVDRVGAPQAWIDPLGAILTAGAVGLLVGFAVPVVGTAAAIGVVLYFCAAIGAHLRARDSHMLPASIFLLLGVAVLVLGLTDRGLA